MEKLKRIFKKQNFGFAALFIIILILVVMVAIGVSITALAVSEHKISRNIVKSAQAYYASESGIEDILLRITDGMNWSSPYNLVLGDSSTTVTVSGAIGGSRTITSEASNLNRIRKTQVIYQITTDNVEFFYGTQVGEGGMLMGNAQSRVIGNVFSNGTVIGGVTGGNSQIDNSVTVAGSGNKIDGLVIGEDALAHICEDSTIGGTLTYVSGGSPGNCTAGETIKSRPNPVDPADFPISQNEIDEWKADAAEGETINNNVLIEDEPNLLGPVQIGIISEPKNLTVDQGATLTVNGTIYVTGDIHFEENAIIELDSGYGSTSGMIIADGEIVVDNNVVLNGSGEEGSYILILSESNSLDPGNPAIFIKNNAIGAIFYADSGLIYLNNNMKAQEITGYKVQIANGAVVEYEIGLASASFSSGTGGGWRVTRWKEIE